jgi:hypothetical protein
MSIPQNIESGKVCLACGSTNATSAKACVNCGRDLNQSEAHREVSSLDDDPALFHVDARNRIELDRFERFDQAELACGLLRSNGIPCELSSMPLPGLPADIILWVYTKDAKLAWALLTDAERRVPKGDAAA